MGEKRPTPFSDNTHTNNKKIKDGNIMYDDHKKRKEIKELTEPHTTYPIILDHFFSL